MNYRQCLDYLYRLQKFGIKLGLSNTARLLNYIGNPHFKYPAVHVAGTNGKGSVCAILHSILSAQGYTTGLYTSPHLISFTERVRIGRKEIEQDFMQDFVVALKNKIDRERYTFFEVTTALAFLYFAEQKIDLAVIETGLGGRLDSTNLVQPEVVGITNIALEHTEILGRSLEKIAYEKGGIIKAGIPTVTGVADNKVKAILLGICRRRKSEMISVPENSKWRIEELGLNGSRFSVRVGRKEYTNLFCNLPGRHQVTNAVFALNLPEQLTRRGWKFSDRAVKRGLRSVYWPARFQIYNRNPLVILDAAHNPAAMEVLVQTFRDLLPERRITFIFGVMADKDYTSMLKILTPIAERIIFVQPEIERAASLKKLHQVAKNLGLPSSEIKSVQKAYRETVSASGTNQVICVTGSHYTLGELLK